MVHIKTSRVTRIVPVRISANLKTWKSDNYFQYFLLKNRSHQYSIEYPAFLMSVFRADIHPVVSGPPLLRSPIFFNCCWPCCHQLNYILESGRDDQVGVDVQQANGEVQQLCHGGGQEPCGEEARPPAHQSKFFFGQWDVSGSVLIFWSRNRINN